MVIGLTSYRTVDGSERENLAIDKVCGPRNALALRALRGLWFESDLNRIIIIKKKDVENDGELCTSTDRHREEKFW